jgi:hypothetical protein
MRRIPVSCLGAVVFAAVSACSSPAEPVAEVTFESIEGSYDLATVGGDRIPVTRGICFLVGCSTVDVITGGRLELNAGLPGRWTIMISSSDPKNPALTSTRVYTGVKLTVNPDGSLLLIEKEGGIPLQDTWEGSASRDEITLSHDISRYTFRRVRG